MRSSEKIRKINSFKFTIRRLVQAGLSTGEIAKRYDLEFFSLKKNISRWRRAEGIEKWPYKRAPKGSSGPPPGYQKETFSRPQKPVSAQLNTPEWFSQCDERFCDAMMDAGYKKI